MPSESDRVKARLLAWPSAAEAGDIERYLTFVTDDVVMVPPNQPLLRGKEDLRSFLRTAIAAATFKIAIDPPEEVVVNGDWAYLRYHLVITITPKSGGASTASDRRYLDIWRRGADGVWRCHRHLWNESPNS